MSDLLLAAGCTVEDLRRKLTADASPLTAWWGHFLNLARNDEEWFAEYAVLAALVTEEAADIARAEAALMRFVRLAAEGDTSLDAQFHTHVTEAPIARWAIQADWAMSQGWLSEDQRAALGRAMLEQAAAFALPHLQSRCQQFDNQILANAICAAAVGHVWGMRHGDDALGRLLYEAGMQRLGSMFGRVPVGGYSFEGSAYQESVVTPLIALAAVFYREQTGLDVLEVGLAPNHTPLRKVLELTWRMIGPAGLTPGWDDYGFSAAAVKSGLVLLARETGDPGPLDTIRELDMWYRNANPAWGHDDRVWSLLWWPEDVDADDSNGASWLAWMEPTVGGALQDEMTGLRLMQYWDENGGMASAGRCQVDANTFTLEAYGALLVLDGSIDLPAELKAVPHDTVVAYAGLEPFRSWQDYVSSTWGGTIELASAVRRGTAGSVAHGNSLIIDGEDWYVPLTPCEGHGEALHQIGPLQVIRSDAAAIYADRYDISRAARHSLSVDGRYVLMCDEVASATPHAITWQAYVRPGAERVAADRVTVDTPEGVRCTLQFAAAGTLSVTPIVKVPKTPVAGSTRVRYDLPAATSQRLDVAIVPLPLREPIGELADWTRSVGDHSEAVSLVDGYLTDDGRQPELPRVYRHEMHLDAGQLTAQLEVGALHLRLAATGPATVIRVNGTACEPLLPAHPAAHWRNAGTNALIVDILPALREGANSIEITAPYFHGESLCGHCEILSASETTGIVTVERLGPDSFRVDAGTGQADLVLLNRTGGCQPWGQAETDARYGVALGADHLGLADVSRYVHTSHGIRLTAEAPCDFSLMGPTIGLAALAPNTRVSLTVPGGAVAVELGATLRISADTNACLYLAIRLDIPTHTYLNGESLGELQGDVTIPLAPSARETPAVLSSAAAVYALAERVAQPTAADRAALLAALRGPDWRVAVAATEVIGRLQLHEAADDLLAMFLAEGEALPYPQLNRWWRFSRMYREPGAQEGQQTDLPSDPDPVKRWRLRMALVGALGRLGDTRAVEPFRAALEAGQDFFPVGAELAVALGRLGDPSVLPLFDRIQDHAEVNTRKQVRVARALLRGEITRHTFESSLK